MIYFIRNKTTGSIKVGHGADPLERLRACQTGSDSELELVGVAPGGRQEEAEFHARFQHLRSCGEWFSPDAAFAAALRQILIAGQKALAEQIRLASEVNWRGLMEFSGPVESGPLETPAPKSRSVAAAAWLRERFAEKREWLSGELFAEARQNGISRDAIFEAREALGLPKPRRVDVPGCRPYWVWRLSDPPAIDQPDAPTPTPFSVGSTVRHSKYGDGIVLGYAGAGTLRSIRVRFRLDGDKTFRLTHALFSPVADATMAGGLHRMNCPYCDAPPDLRWHTFGNGARHIKATCPECGRFLRWQPQTPEAVTLADAHELSEPNPQQGRLFP